MKALLIGIITGFIATAQASEPIKIVAAENFYGDVAEQIGANHVIVTSVLNNPDQDPHMFEASPSIISSLQLASMIIVNGAGYDAWMTKLIPESRKPDLLDVASLTHKSKGDNPHLWYDVDVISQTADEIALRLMAKDPDHKVEYAENRDRFQRTLQALKLHISTSAEKIRGLPVTASEPVFGYMAEALRLDMRNKAFQLAILNNAEPSVSDIIAFEDDLKHKNVRAFLYNSQVSSPTVSKLKALAEKNHIPTVGVSETEPANTKYQDWMTFQIDALIKALLQ